LVVLSAILIFALGSTTARAVQIPSWIKQNTIVAYNFSSAALSNGLPVSGQSLAGIEQITVSSVSSTVVAGTVITAFNGLKDTAQFSCNLVGACVGFPAQFWVDPADPTHSRFGPNGEPFTIIGTGPFQAAGVSWTAVTMAYTNAATGVQLVTIFDINSGLILEYSENYPTEEVILQLRAISGTTLPTTPPGGPTGTPALTSLLSSVLPSSRSVQVGGTATAFASIINTGNIAGTGCGLAPATNVPATFAFQTTNPSTNAVTGTANSTVTIAAGQTQTFVFAFTPSAAFAPTEIGIKASCANSSAAPAIPGVNSLLLSASTTPVPDIVALAASSDPGIVDIPGAGGTGVFAVATVNVGATSQITASADTGTTTLPVSLFVCQTNPSSGMCLGPLAPSVSTTISANSTPTFGVFVFGGGTVPFDPANNRVNLRFSDPSGAVRGATSVAVRTQ
jgi:hypothetical protein